MSRQLRVAGLFAGIGGIEVGLHRAGHETLLLNELDQSAREVLGAHFPEVLLSADVTELTRLPEVDLVAAGFPCTDISQAGRKIGIGGEQSGLVNEVFRLVEGAKTRPAWLLLENVSYMLRLDKGQGMRHLINSVEALGYRWAYRVVDARAFGMPQRRQRILFLASRDEDPRTVLFADDDRGDAYDDSIGAVDSSAGYGFYWTEGLRGLGWVKNAVPTIKGGSGLGIPSAPAIWYPGTGEVGTPQIEDGERMQGFPADWTLPSVMSGRRLGTRWKQVGNAVCVPMSEWVGDRLSAPGTIVEGDWDTPLDGRRWPLAAYGAEGRGWHAPVSSRPMREPFAIQKFLGLPLKPLSPRATAGFLSRARRSKNLRFADGFLSSLDDHLALSEAGSLRV
jgi:DNA (cytosine-5)-methyltransferase 1